MDVNSNGPIPPVNNACLPDIYNRLDAETIERTRVINNQLTMRMLSQQKVITKYKNEAKRMLKVEKSLVSKDLRRIHQKLPAVGRIRDFEQKFFHSRRSSSEPSPRVQRKKRYQNDKNEDAICQRCYIHHLPTKKKYYKVEVDTPMPLVLDGSTDRAALPADETTPTKSTSAPSLSPSALRELLAPSSSAQERESHHSSSPTLSKRGQGYRLIPASRRYQFLERDKNGHERDLNDTLTPRLMANEMWKNVVRNVCNQSIPEPQLELSQRKCRDPILVNNLIRAQTIEGRVSSSNKNRRPSTRRTSRSHAEARSPSRAAGNYGMRSTSRNNSSADEKRPNGVP